MSLYFAIFLLIVLGGLSLYVFATKVIYPVFSNYREQKIITNPKKLK